MAHLYDHGYPVTDADVEAIRVQEEEYDESERIRLIALGKEARKRKRKEKWANLIHLADEINAIWRADPPASAAEAKEDDWNIFHDKAHIIRCLKGKPTKFPLIDMGFPGGHLFPYCDDQDDEPDELWAT